MVRFFIVLTLSFLYINQLSAQCGPEYIEKVQSLDSSCNIIKMSEQRFTDFYVAKRNLKEVAKISKLNKRLIDSLYKEAKKVDEISNLEIEALKLNSTLLRKGYEECYENVIDLEIDVVSLSTSRNKIKKQRNVSVLVTLSTIILTIFIK